MDQQLATAQTLKYAQELSDLYGAEREQRQAAEEAVQGLKSSYAMTVRALAAAVDLRDDSTGAHAERVTELALALTRRIDPKLAENPELEYGFLLHDIGKIGIRDSVLLKEGPLSESDLREMRVHTLLGEQLVARIPYLNGVARDVVAAHHERWDGTGYPYGLKGTEIPLAARIFAVVDVFDALTSDRPYRIPLPEDAALAEIERGSGTQFDPSIVPAFAELARDLENAA